MWAVAEHPEPVDLRNEPGSRVTLAALAAVGELRRGERCVLLTREDPALLMAALNLRLRDALAWETAAMPGHWRTTVRPAADTPPRDLIDALTRDHRRLDELLGRTLRLLNAGDSGRAKGLLDEFAAGLRRHARAENEILAPALGPAPGFEPLQLMLREHAELLEQLQAVEQCFVEAPAGQFPEAWEVEPFAAILSGTVAKHEHREEGGLFPAWAAALAARPSEEREALHERVRRALEP
jgi:Hemerythrin HHE cation binding domain